MCRVVLGHAKFDAAVRGVGVEAFTLPAIAGESDVEPAVDGMTLRIAGNMIQRDAAIRRIKAEIPVHAGQVDATVHGVQFGSKVARHMEVVVDAVAGVIEEMCVRAVVTDVAVVRVDHDLVEEVVGFGFGRRPGCDARFERDIGAVFAHDIDAAVDGVHADAAGGQNQGGAAHLANMGFAPVVAVVVAFAVVPVAGLGCRRGVDMAAGMRKRNAQKDDDCEAKDKNGEAAHGTDLAGWVRGWMHRSSL